MDIALDKYLLSIMLLYSLANTLENFRCAIESRDTLPDPENLKVTITEKYTSRQQGNGNADSVMFVKSNSQNKSKGGAKNKQKDFKIDTKAKSTSKCEFCGIKGHHENQSRKKKIGARTSRATK